MSDNSGRDRRPPQRGLHTLRDLQGEAGPSQGPGHDSDSEDDQDFFAGGEKSGLAVHQPGTGGGGGGGGGGGNPRDQIEGILDRARRNVPRPGGDDDEPQSSSNFSGAGQTLGGDDTPSQTIPDPHADAPQAPPRVNRTLHLWRDGFSVDDGELYRFDDPANAATLNLINQGRAPLDILDVEHGQEVDLQVHPHRDEDYKPPKKKYKPFSGTGQRLGSPTPGSTGPTDPPPAPAASSSTLGPASASAGPSPPAVAVNEAQPTITLQIRLGDGTRLQGRFNTTHTIGDVYAFVDAASPASQQREWVLMTTFPSKELLDRDVALGDLAEFKRGGVVVQKWK